MMRSTLLLFVLLLLAGAGSPAFARTINGVAAVVNTEVITTYQLDRAVEDVVAQRASVTPLAESEKASVRQRVLERLINEKLLAQRSQELGLRVADEEVNVAIEDVMVSNNLDREGLEAALNAEGLTMAAYREQISNDILRYKLLAQEVNHRAQVTSAEVRRYFNENIEQYDTQPRLHVSRISFSLPSDRHSSEFEQVEEQARRSRERLLAGEPFSEVLAAVDSRASGGIMGELVLTDLAEPLQVALRDLPVGAVTEPTEWNRQLHLFIVTDRVAAEDNAFEQARKSIEERLKRQKTEERFVEWEKELRQAAYVDKRI